MGIDWGAASLSLGYATETDVAGTGQGGRIGDRNPVTSARRDGHARWLGKQGPERGEQAIADPLEPLADPAGPAFGPGLQDWIDIVNSLKDVAMDYDTIPTVPHALGIALPYATLTAAGPRLPRELERLAHLPMAVCSRPDALAAKLLLKPRDSLLGPEPWSVLAVAAERVGERAAVVEIGRYLAHLERGLALALRQGEMSASRLDDPEEQLPELLTEATQALRDRPVVLVAGGDLLGAVTDWCLANRHPQERLDQDPRNVAAGAAASAWAALMNTPTALVDDWAEIRYRLAESSDDVWLRLGRPLPLGLGHSWHVREMVGHRPVAALRLVTASGRFFDLRDAEGGVSSEITLPQEPRLGRVVVTAPVDVNDRVALDVEARYEGGQLVREAREAALPSDEGAAPGESSGVGLFLEPGLAQAAGLDARGVPQGGGDRGLPLGVAVPLGEGEAKLGPEAARAAAEQPGEWYCLPSVLRRLTAGATYMLRTEVTAAQVAEALGDPASDAPTCLIASASVPEGVLTALAEARHARVAPLPAAAVAAVLADPGESGLPLVEALLAPEPPRLGIFYWGRGEARVCLGAARRGPLNLANLARQGLFAESGAAEWPVAVSLEEIEGDLLWGLGWQRWLSENVEGYRGEGGASWREPFEMALLNLLGRGEDEPARRLLRTANATMLSVAEACEALFDSPEAACPIRAELGAETPAGNVDRRRLLSDLVAPRLAEAARDPRPSGVQYWLVTGPMLRLPGAAETAREALGAGGAVVIIRPADDLPRGAAHLARWVRE